MHKHRADKKSQSKPSIIDTAKEALRHVLVIGVISTAGHFATASLSTSAGALGMGIYPAIGGMSFMYGS
jgi:hypothetical protein